MIFFESVFVQTNLSINITTNLTLNEQIAIRCTKAMRTSSSVRNNGTSVNTTIKSMLTVDKLTILRAMWFIVWGTSITKFTLAHGNRVEQVKVECIDGGQ